MSLTLVWREFWKQIKTNSKFILRRKINHIFLLEGWCRSPRHTWLGEAPWGTGLGLALTWSLVGSVGWQGLGKWGCHCCVPLAGAGKGHALPSACQTCLVRNGKYFPKTCKNALRLLALGLSCTYLVHFSLLLFINFRLCWGIFFFPFLFLWFFPLDGAQERVGSGAGRRGWVWALPPVTGLAPLNFHRLSLVSVVLEMIYGTNGQQNKLFLL